MTLVIPAACWTAVLEALRRPPHDRERIAFLDGPRPTGDVMVATTVTLPVADEYRGNVHVEADEMSRAGRHLRQFTMLRLAQVHTHPTDWTGHSPYDDEKAFSQRNGAISIVIPNFAGCAPGLSDCGVHIRDQHGWREIVGPEKTASVQIVPSVIDLRP